MTDHMNTPFPGAALDGGERPEDDLEADTVLDADLLLVTEYLAGRLTPAEATAVERRFDDDPQFWENVEPLVSLLVMRAKYNLRYRGEEHAAAPSPAPYVPLSPNDLYPGETWLDRLRLRIFSPLVAVGGLVIATVCGLGWVEVIHPIIRGFGHAYAPGHVAVAELTQHRALTIGLNADSVVNTDAIETRDIPLDGGSRAIVRPGSRFSYRIAGDPGTDYHRAALDGEELLDLQQTWIISTDLAVLRIGPGLFAIRSDTAGDAVLLSVGSGTAVAWPIEMRADSVVLYRGEYLRIPAKGPIMRSTTGEDFPSLAESGNRSSSAAPTPPTIKPPTPHGE